jgi:hypothetical protein
MKTNLFKFLAILCTCVAVVSMLVYFITSKPKEEIHIKKEMTDKPVERINLIEEKRGVYIIEVDNHLYVSTVQGGIIHMESCPCKTR